MELRGSGSPPVSWLHLGDAAPLKESHRKLKAQAPYRASASCLHFTDEEIDPKKGWEVTKAAFLNSGTWDQIQLLLAWFRYSFSEHLSSSWMRCTKRMYGMKDNHGYIRSSVTMGAPDLGIE